MAEVIQKLAENGGVDLTSFNDSGMTCGKPNAQSKSHKVYKNKSRLTAMTTIPEISP